MGLLGAAARRPGRHGLHDDHVQVSPKRDCPARTSTCLLDRLRATWQGPLRSCAASIVDLSENDLPRRESSDSSPSSRAAAPHTYPLYVTYEDGSLGVSNIWLTASYDKGQTWTAPILVNDNTTPGDELQPNLAVTRPVAKSRSLSMTVVSVARRLGVTIKHARAYLGPSQPFGAANYCVNTALSSMSRTCSRSANLRVSAHTRDPQLNAPHSSCICGRTTFIGDYFGIDANGSDLYTTSVSTYDSAGENPSNYQQQIVARIPILRCCGRGRIAAPPKHLDQPPIPPSGRCRL